MSRRIDRLISHIRKVSENDTENSTTDITDNEIIEFINEGQHRIQARIIAQFPRVFVKESEIDSVADQEEYSLPSDVFLASRVISVEYTTDTGSDPTFYKLKPGYERNRMSDLSGVPEYYIRRDKLDDNTASILLSPKPDNSSGTIRVTYIQAIDEMDKRRGIISAVTTSATQLTALTLDVSGDPPIDSDALEDFDHICIVDKLGNIKMRNVQFDSVNTSTGVVTLTSSHTFTSGETASVSNYVVGGKDRTTHSRFPRNIERYLIQFAVWKIFKRDSSTDATDQLSEVMAIESDIIESFQDIQEDIYEIAIIDEWD